MKRVRLLIIGLLLGVTFAFAAANEPHGLETARILSVKTYDHGRIAFWEGHVPVYDNYPFYDITLMVGPKKYVARYESPTGYYPSSWKADSEVQIRLEGKGKMSLLNNTEEVPVEIVTTHLNDCVTPNTPPIGRIQAGSEVPCE
jgi:hypothetical protein